MKSLQKTRKPHCTVRPLATECAILTLEPIKSHYVQYIQCDCWSLSSTFRGLPLDDLGGTWSALSFTGGWSATLSLSGGCAGPGRTFHCFLIGWCWTFKPPFESKELRLSGVFTVTFLWTATGSTIGHFQSSSYLSRECIALGRVGEGLELKFSQSGSSIWAC